MCGSVRVTDTSDLWWKSAVIYCLDVETFYGLLHDHAEEAGCEVIADMVEAVEREGSEFSIELQDGGPIEAGRVVAAARYDASYLRPLEDDAMFARREAVEAVETEGRGRRFDRFAAGRHADRDARERLAGPVDHLAREAQA